jgi:hypothetical protein
MCKVPKGRQSIAWWRQPREGRRSLNRRTPDGWQWPSAAAPRLLWGGDDPGSRDLRPWLLTAAPPGLLPEDLTGPGQACCAQQIT